MYHSVAARIAEALTEFIRRKYAIDARPAIERPPKLELGEAATPVCFELAKRLKRAPRQIAQEIAAEIGPIEGVARWEVAGGGYLNAFFDRGAYFRATFAKAGFEAAAAAADAPKTVVEHTNINPNKAAHIGHLRNAALGDAFVRILRHAGERVEAQNYIDNTGVQVADVVVGFVHLEKKSVDEVRALAAQPKFDYFCWDLYSRVTQFFEEDPSRLILRGETLKTIEEGRGEAGAISEMVSAAIVRCHLRTMERLGVEYDLLPRESEILHLKFWDAAFEQLKSRGAIQLATEGKNAGCWVMRLGDAPAADEGDDESDTKIIVRSNGTVTYVGKDIAYQLWKFGLLGRDFHYTRFHTHPSGHVVWMSSSGAGEKDTPAFGRAASVYNVIDSRQSYLQRIVIEGLRALGFDEQADHSTHFAYEMVVLTPRCAAELGYEIPPEDAKKPFVDVSGRKGTGVKADDLLERLETSARKEVDARHPNAPEGKRATLAHQIAVGALRYFLLKFTRSAKIPFDFADALSFEGETGPYCQYAVVRARNIFRKWHEQEGTAPEQPMAFRMRTDYEPTLLAAPDGNDLWEVVLLAGRLGSELEAARGAQEPAFVAKYAFQLAQAFNLFYHKHHILSEADAEKKAFLLALTSIVERQLVAALGLLGIEAPEKM